eukprot:UN05167
MLLATVNVNNSNYKHFQNNSKKIDILIIQLTQANDQDDLYLSKFSLEDYVCLRTSTHLVRD